ncbi:unnamed protein product [Auanema sp. JU1783]|nr:unnamed protein product [Auanema sp. JU1783]
MFILQSSKPSYCSDTFASSSCHTEFNGKALTRQPSLGGLPMGLRRNSSNLSQISNQDLCSADATQIEIDFLSLTSIECHVIIKTPTGEVGILEFNGKEESKAFLPSQTGCGHGLWTFSVYTLMNNSKVLRSTETMQLDGVGSLFFSIADDLVPHLMSQEFLHMSGLCPKHRH